MWLRRRYYFPSSLFTLLMMSHKWAAVCISRAQYRSASFLLPLRIPISNDADTRTVDRYHQPKVVELTQQYVPWDSMFSDDLEFILVSSLTWSFPNQIKSISHLNKHRIINGDQFSAWDSHKPQNRSSLSFHCSHRNRLRSAFILGKHP